MRRSGEELRWHTGQTTDAVVKFCSDDRVPEGASWVCPLQGGPTTWGKSRELAGCEKHGIGRCGDSWGTPIYSLGRLSADIFRLFQSTIVYLYMYIYNVYIYIYIFKYYAYIYVLVCKF